MTTAAAWAAPVRDTPLDAVVRVPGSKSATNRALVLAALATGPSVVRGPLVARDTDLMAAGLRGLGAEITDADPGSWLVRPAPPRGPATVDCGLAGTVMRFVPPVAALADGTVTFDGDRQARHRPMAPLLLALRDLGVDVRGDSLPFAIDGRGRVAGGTVSLDASGSSQFVSALLLAGARYDAGVDVRHVGKPLPSMPHITMTVDMLRRHGVDVLDDEPNRWRVARGEIGAVDSQIEPDLSSAAPFLAAALVCGGSVTVADWPADTRQPGDLLRDLLEQMGGRVELTRAGLVVEGSGHIVGVDVDLHDVGELTPVVAALAALADGPSHLRGIGHLRGHETDRLAALSTELNSLGGAVRETTDGLDIDPKPLHGGLFRSHDDHRLAQAAAVIGLAVRGIGVDDIAATAKTFPGFARLWETTIA